MHARPSEAKAYTVALLHATDKCVRPDRQRITSNFWMARLGLEPRTDGL
jgi:hypothetical protein